MAADARKVYLCRMTADLSHQPLVPRDTFALRLIALRIELGLTVEEAATKCGLKYQTWSTWERGAIPRRQGAVVAAISLALGVDRDWLMYGGPLRPETPAPEPGQPSLGSSRSDSELMQTRLALWGESGHFRPGNSLAA